MKSIIPSSGAAILLGSCLSVAEAQTPIITAQPTNEVVLVENAASFSVAVSGTGPFTYQWQFNGTNLSDGIITTVAGNGTNGYSGDGGPATNAGLNDPSGVAVDAFGNLFVADASTKVIREVGTNGIITTVAGGGTNGLGDGGAATKAELNNPHGVAVDASGNLFIVDTANQRIRKVGTNGIITTVAGNGTPGYSGDGGPATSAELNYPHGVAVDASGNLFIADYDNNVIRKVGANGIITTVAGNGTSGYSGDGGLATQAELAWPSGVAVDTSGNLFIADWGNNRMREVGTNGIITTVAGNGTNGYSGDGGAATNAELSGPSGVAVDTSGNLFIADASTNVIREVGTDGIITTVAGNGIAGFSGDGGLATEAELAYPAGVAVDASGNLFIADEQNQRIRVVVPSGTTLVLNVVVPSGATLVLNNVSSLNAGSYDVVVSSPYGSVTSSVVTLHVQNLVRYVNASSANPMPPYTNWATAATDIQDAVDAAGGGDEIVVTNGFYYAPVTVNTPLTLQSVNGPSVTVISGLGGIGASQCVYLANDAVLEGFTLTNGSAEFGGGVNCESTNAVLTNCVLTGNEGWHGGGAYGGTLINCTLTGNWSESGGGAYGGTLINCTLTGNWATMDFIDCMFNCVTSGGGAAGCTLINCTLNGNWALTGGGANGGTLTNCTLTGNSAEYGGGASSCTLDNCVLSGNSTVSAYGVPWGSGGGAWGCTLNNCALTDNSAINFGGGAEGCTLNNCTLTGNSANGPDYWGYGSGYGGGAENCTLNNCTVTGNSAPSGVGGGVYDCTNNNCIVYFNLAPNGSNYDSSSTLNYSCTTPMPTGGVGNISADPQLASAWYLSAQSPCIGAGSATYASGTDIDGEAWASPPSIGCEEDHVGAVTGLLTVAISAHYTNVATGFPLGLTALIEGRTDLSVWDFGDGFVQVNEPYTSHTWTAPGDYLVALWAYNDSYPEGASAMITIHVDNGVHYVAATSSNPVAPYTSWATAATNIQDAVNVAGAGGTVFVTNGVYTPVTVNPPLIVQSVNGPDVTVINGGGAQECLYLATNAVIVGFTLTNGVAEGNGGGVYCESTSAVLTNCVLSGDSAAPYDVGGLGGGAYGGTLNNCTLTGNSAPWGSGGGAYGSMLNNCTLTVNWCFGGYGGGAENCTLNNCTLISNSAVNQYGGGADWSMLNNCTLNRNSAPYGAGGGASSCMVNNCIVYFNTAMNGANYDPSSWLNYCCTTPLPGGVGNITKAPVFVDYAGGNLRLQSNSPCINSGNNAYVVGSTDLDGNPRIVGGTVDIGAYEYQTPLSMISYAWLQQYGLPINTNTDTADLDGTGMNVYQDWIAGLNPTNALSVLQMTSATATNNAAGLVVTWESVSGIMYFLQSSTNLAGQPAFWTIQSNIVGQAGTTSYTDTTATNAGPYFYRVGVGN
jgi:hypothetical protein